MSKSVINSSSGRINRQTGKVTLASTMVVIWMVRLAWLHAFRDEFGHDKSERPGPFNLTVIFDNSVPSLPFGLQDQASDQALR